MQAAILWSDLRSSFTASTDRSGIFAPWLHTLTQLPHPIQRSLITSACPFIILMALTGHSRTQVKQTLHLSLMVKTSCR
jgi:hypothetical protein